MLFDCLRRSAAASRRLLKIFLIFVLLVSSVGEWEGLLQIPEAGAIPTQYYNHSDVGTLIGVDTTNINCAQKHNFNGPGIASAFVGLLTTTYNCFTKKTEIRMTMPTIGVYQAAYFLQSTPYLANTQIAGATNPSALTVKVKGGAGDVGFKYEFCDYDPLGLPGNCTSLGFSTTEFPLTTQSATLYPQTSGLVGGMIPAGHHLGVKIWMVLGTMGVNIRQTVYTQGAGMTSYTYINETPVPTNEIVVSGLETVAATTTDFTAAFAYTGDTNLNATVTLWYCNDSLLWGCDPLAGNSIPMTASLGSYTTTVTPFAPPSEPGHRFNLRAMVIDPDGVVGAPLNGSAILQLSTSAQYLLTPDNALVIGADTTNLICGASVNFTAVPTGQIGLVRNFSPCAFRTRIRMTMPAAGSYQVAYYISDLPYATDTYLSGSPNPSVLTVKVKGSTTDVGFRYEFCDYDPLGLPGNCLSLGSSSTESPITLKDEVLFLDTLGLVGGLLPAGHHLGVKMWMDLGIGGVGQRQTIYMNADGFSAYADLVETLPDNAITVYGLDNPNSTATGFDVLIPYTGDINANATTTLWYCNDSLLWGCDPLAGSSMVLARGTTAFTGTVIPLSPPSEAGHSFTLRAVINDPDGSTGDPVNGTAVLASNQAGMYMNVPSAGLLIGADTTNLVCGTRNNITSQLPTGLVGLISTVPGVCATKTSFRVTPPMQGWYELGYMLRDVPYVGDTIVYGTDLPSAIMVKVKGDPGGVGLRYEFCDYDPLGLPGNCTSLGFTSTESPLSTNDEILYPQTSGYISGIVLAGHHLGVKIWMNITSLGALGQRQEVYLHSGGFSNYTNINEASPANDLIVYNLTPINVTESSFTASVNFVGDFNNNAVATLYYCNNSLVWGCNPMAGDSIVMTRGAGVYLAFANNFIPPADPGHDFTMRVVFTDPDGVTGSPLNGTVTLQESNNLLIYNLQTSNITPTGFDVSVDYSGDINANGTTTLWYCNATDVPGCNPELGVSVLMTRGVASLTGSVTGLVAPNNLGDVMNLRVIATDPDGVSGSPQDGTTTIGLSGGLSVDIVNAVGISVANPIYPLNLSTFSFVPQVVTGVLGDSNQIIRLDNQTAVPAWSVTIAATSGATALWDGGIYSFDFNDPVGGGQLTINPATATVSRDDLGSTAGIFLGVSTAFNQGVTDSITLFYSLAGAVYHSYDFVGASLFQLVPGAQRPGSYSLSLTLTAI